MIQDTEVLITVHGNKLDQARVNLSLVESMWGRTWQFLATRTSITCIINTWQIKFGQDFYISLSFMKCMV